MHVEWQGQQLLLRPATVTDRAFIFATWMRSYREQHRDVDYEQYHRCQVRRVERLWDRAHIVCREPSPDSIHGWIVGGPGVLHYVFVPLALRGKGLAGAVVRKVCGLAVAYSHRWPFDRVPSGWKHNEYLLEDTR